MKIYRIMVIVFLVTFKAVSQTIFSSGGGMYSRMLNDLKKCLYDSRIRTVELDGKKRRMFVSWIRDHIHTMKAYKYWEKDMSSYLEFFLERQRPSGMIFDYWASYKNQNVGQLYFTNIFDSDFFYVDVNEQLFLFRMPIEADLEYLMVEGAYTCWQTTGDTVLIRKWLPALVKGMNYLMTDPLRWSSRFLMVKRPYSIDTWDFTSEPDSLTGNDRLLVHIGNDKNTPKGIMFGDNSGMFQACKQLSELFRITGQPNSAQEWHLEGELFKLRLNTICWNGNFYAHFIPEDPVPPHIRTDPIHALTLSNTYTMNRGATTREMAASIIQAYQAVGTATGAVAEWFGIYPPIQPHFGKYKVGEYMNGAVLPLVGGELAKAAFQNGFESYGIEQLKKMNLIMDKNNRHLPGCVNMDGTAQREAIPDEWGQAAFVSALIEGLAGVVDKGSRFQDVELSPRWIYADVDQIRVTVGYGDDGRQVFYEYLFDPENNEMTVTTDGSFETFTLRLPVPVNSHPVRVMINGRETGAETDRVNQSAYAVIQGQGSKNSIRICFKSN
jgi:hypothetical protein